jgi:hypothetical protein
VGKGPRFYLNGPRRIISDEADADWIREQESLAQSPETKIEIERASNRSRSLVMAGIEKRRAAR